MLQNEKALLEEVQKLDISEELELSSGMAELGAMRNAIEKKIRMLLDQPSERLMQLLYRIDINEDKARTAFASADPDTIAKELAVLILDRMIRKAETRLKYRNNEI